MIKPLGWVSLQSLGVFAIFAIHGRAAGDAERSRLAKLSNVTAERYARGNAQVRAEFAAIGGAGVDVRNAYDWDSAIAFQEAAWADGRARAAAWGQTWQNVKDGASDVTGYAWDATKRSFELYGDAFGKIYDSTVDLLTLEHLKKQPIRANTLSVGGASTLRDILGGSLNINVGVQSDGTVGWAVSGGGFAQLSEQHFKEGNLNLSADGALLHWEGVKFDATLENIFSGYSTNTDYDITAFKYDFGWQESTAWDKAPYSSLIVAEGSGPRIGFDVFGRNDKSKFPFEVSTGIEHQIGNKVNTYDAGVAGRWLYWLTR